MHDARAEILQWVNEGVLPRERVHDALRTAGVTPSAAQWRDFLERSLTWLGATLVAAAAVYFVAANWQALGRYAKFALIEGALVVALACVWWRELDSLAGRVALFAAAVLTGVLLALVGQVYQTGADTFELFAAWAFCILPWVLVAREPSLWVVWLALVDIAIVLYFRTNVARGIGSLDLLFVSRSALWCVLAIDAAALALWEYIATHRDGWLGVRWAPRLVAAGIAAIVTLLVIGDIMEFGHDDRAAGVAAYAAFAAAMYWAYRVRRRDLVMLAGLVLTAIIVIAAACARWLFDSNASGAFLLTGIVVVACTAAGAWWLKAVGDEASAKS